MAEGLVHPAHLLTDPPARDCHSLSALVHCCPCCSGHGPCTEFDRRCVLPTGVLQWRGAAIACPGDVPAALVQRYGEGWRVPAYMDKVRMTDCCTVGIRCTRRRQRLQITLRWRCVFSCRAATPSRGRRATRRCSGRSPRWASGCEEPGGGITGGRNFVHATCQFSFSTELLREIPYPYTMYCCNSTVNHTRMHAAQPQPALRGLTGEWRICSKSRQLSIADAVFHAYSFLPAVGGAADAAGQQRPAEALVGGPAAGAPAH